MKTHKRYYYYFLLVLLFIVFLSSQSMATEDSIEVLITSIGQSAEARMISVLATRNEIKAAYEQIASREIIKNYKIIIAVVGGSSKGLGAAGIDKDQEITRTKELVQEIKAQNVKLLVMHVGGGSKKRRTFRCLLRRNCSLCRSPDYCENR